MLKKVMSAPTAVMFSMVCAVWLVTNIALGCGAIDSLLFATRLGVCFLIGYGFLSFWRGELRPLYVVIAAVLGFQIAATAYPLARAYAGGGVHLGLLAGLALFGVYRIVGHAMCAEGAAPGKAEAMLERRAIVTGVAVMLIVGSVFYFSGRMEQDGLVFYGPMARDPIYHLALLQRLHIHVPADNFVVSGFPAPSYHFFNDVGLDLLGRGFFTWLPDLDVFFRLYPSAMLFALGLLAYWIPARLCASRRAGLIGAALVLFGGDLSWPLGLAQSIKAAAHPAALTDKLFTPWIFWDPITQIYSLVHRPAYYNGVLMFLAGLACIAGRQRSLRVAWAIAGVIWGLMAGFNYTFAAVTGVSVVIAAAYYVLRRRSETAISLALCAGAVALGSVPANCFIVPSLTGSGEGSHFSLEFGVLVLAAYSNLLGFLHVGGLVLAAAVVIFVVVAYGLKLAAVWAIPRAKGFRFAASLPAATVVLAVIAVSVALGLLAKSSDGAALNLILLQPSGPLLALFATLPIVVWTRRGQGLIRPVTISIFLLIGPVQAGLAFELGYKAVLTDDYVIALRQIAHEADPQDVIAFLPESFPTTPILGAAPASNNFYLAAITGLRNYYTTEAYTARESGRPDGLVIYEDRTAIVRKFLSGTASRDDVERLRRDGVRWVVLPEQVGFAAPSGARVWARGARWTIYRLAAPGVAQSG